MLAVNAAAILNNDRFLERRESGRAIHFLCNCFYGSFFDRARLALDERKSLWDPPLSRSTDGWGFSQLGGGAAGTHSPGALKQQIIGALHATQYLRGEL